MNYSNTREFISEVEKRPALWDMTLKEYNNREFKKKLWKELVNLFGGAELTAEKDRRELRQNLQKKWKNIRDSFAREVRRIKRCETGVDSARKSPYIYYEHMLFLKTTVHNSTPVKMTSPEDCSLLQSETPNKTPLECNEIASTPLSPVSPLQPDISTSIIKSHLGPNNKKRKTDMPNASKELINVLCKSIQTREEFERQSEADEDRMFLLSLLPDLKKVSDDLKFPTKMEIMNVIQKAKTGSSFTSEVPTYCQLTPVHPTYLGVSSYENLTENQFQTVAVPEIKPATTISVQSVETSEQMTTPKEEVLELF